MSCFAAGRRPFQSQLINSSSCLAICRRVAEVIFQKNFSLSGKIRSSLDRITGNSQPNCSSFLLNCMNISMILLDEKVTGISVRKRLIICYFATSLLKQSIIGMSLLDKSEHFSYGKVRF